MTEDQAIGRIAQAIGQQHRGLETRSHALALTAWQTMREISLEDRAQAPRKHDCIDAQHVILRTSEA